MFLPLFLPVSPAPARSRTCSRFADLSGALRPTSLYLVKTIALMSLSLFALLLCTQPAQAQGPGGYPGGPGWSVQDQDGNPIPANQDGSGYPLKGTLTGGCTFTGAYQDALAAGQKPNAPIGYPFNPNPANYQGWLFKGGASSPDDTYNPYAVWTMVSASNYATNTWGGGLTGYLSDYGNENINGSLKVNVGGTLWAIFQSSDPPHAPDHIDVLLSTSVSADVSSNTFGGPPQGGLTGSVTATDSTFSETASAPGGVSQVTGRHLLRVAVDPKTGKAPVSLGGNVKATASNSVAYGEFGYLPGTMYYGYSQTNGSAAANASGAISATAQIDDRDVIIQSNLGQTYYKGTNALPQPNMRQPDGTMTDDTAVYNSPGSGNFGVLVNYQAVTMGSWAVNSSYAWSNTATQWVTTPATQLHGTFNPDPITPLQVDYFKTSSSVPGSPGTTDNVHVLLTDGQDGATAAANYNLNFHAEYENFLKLTDVMQTGPWTRVSPAAVSGPNGGPFPLPINIPVSVTASVDPSGSAGSAVAAQYGVTVGTTYSTAVPRDASKWQMLRNKYCWIEDQVFWEQMTGTVDNYETQGYVQQISWSLNKPYNATNPLNDYTEQIINSDSPPTN